MSLCDSILGAEEMEFRATKDIDIVLIIEAMTVEFGKRFWEYIKEGEYEHRNKSTGSQQFYRFEKPKSKEYPHMTEIFSRRVAFMPFKAKAWLDLNARKQQGEDADGKNIRKHKNDIFRLTSLLSAEGSEISLSEEIKADMRQFLAALETENVDLKSLGIKGSSQRKRMDIMYSCYNIEK